MIDFELFITYTNAAVDEIKRRLDRYMDNADIYTIHGFIIDNIIKPFQEDLRNIMRDHTYSLIGSLCSSLIDFELFSCRIGGAPLLSKILACLYCW